jgi:myo-inositol 2-dehydrogenase / D-chiro-inositol 1-dehydrogenase
MKVGLLGAGRIGALHAGVLARDPGVDEILVGDADTQRPRKSTSSSKWYR